MVIRVAGGTNAGCKTLRLPRTASWVCAHGHENRPNHLTCMTSGCREKRPAE